MPSRARVDKTLKLGTDLTITGIAAIVASSARREPMAKTSHEGVTCLLVVADLPDPDPGPTRAREVGDQATSFTYDLAGRLTKTTYADGTFASQTYDALGRLVISVSKPRDSTTCCAVQV